MKQETIARDEAFAEVCRRLIAGYRKCKTAVPVSVLLKQAIASRPDRHYISFESALRMLYDVRRKGHTGSSRHATEEKWQELNEQVNAVMARRPKISFPRAVAFTLTYKRPSHFYIPVPRARAILRRVLIEHTMVVSRA